MRESFPSTHTRPLPLSLFHLCPAPAPHLPCSNMLVAYNALLHFLGSLGELQRSLGVYRGMARVGPRPDVVTYNTLIAAAAGGGNVKVAMQVFSDMVDAGGRCAVRAVQPYVFFCTLRWAGGIAAFALGLPTVLTTGPPGCHSPPPAHLPARPPACLASPVAPPAPLACLPGCRG